MANDLADVKISINVDDSDVTKSYAKFERMKKQLATLQLALRKNEISQKAYNRAVQQMSNELGRVTGDLNNARSSVMKWSYALSSATDEQLRFQTTSGKGMRRLEVLAQQTGYQLGDLAVQIQGGTNAAVALGQQGSQLLGFFGPAGALAGAGLAITTAFIAPLLKAKEAAEEFNKELEKTSQALELATSGAGSQGMLEINKKIAAVNKEIYEITNRTIDLSYADEELKKQILSAVEANKAADEKRLKTLTEQKEQLIAQREQLELVKALTNSEAQEAENVREAREAIIRAENERQKRLKEERIKSEQEILQATIDAHMQAYEFQTELMKDTYQEGLKLVEVAEEFGERLGIGLLRAIELMQMAKAEATVGLDAFGGAGEFKYSAPSTFDPNKGKKRGGAKKETVGEYLKSLMEEAEYKRRIVGLSEQETRIQEIIFQAKQRDFVVTVEQASAIAAVEEQTRKLIDAEQKRKSMMETIEGHITNGFMAMVDGSQSVENAFKGMLRNILLEIYKQQVAEPAAEGIGNLLKKGFSSWFGGGQTTASAYGNIFQNGSVKAFANGGVVNGATFFPMSNGTGLMGEAGPEAIMPLKRGPNGKLGVEASGGQQVVVNQSFNFAANGDESVKKIIAQAAPQIAQMTQKQIMDSRRRGGQMKAAFS